MEDLVLWIVEWVKSMGYLGIFIMTMVESTFIPVPAEITMIPAGYLVQQGAMNGWLVMLSALLGTVTGALINYTIAYYFGRKLIMNYGRYFFMPQYKLIKMERYFEKYGIISTFIGRLLPGVRHYISFPAGLARMRLNLFILYTALGGGIWLAVLFILGYYIGENETVLKEYMIYIKLGLLLCLALFAAFFMWKRKRNKTMIAEIVAEQDKEAEPALPSASASAPPPPNATTKEDA